MVNPFRNMFFENKMEMMGIGFESVFLYNALNHQS